MDSAVAIRIDSRDPRPTREILESAHPGQFGFLLERLTDNDPIPGDQDRVGFAR